MVSKNLLSSPLPVANLLTSTCLLSTCNKYVVVVVVITIIIIIIIIIKSAQ